MQINLLTDGYKDSEKFYQAFLDDTLQQSSFVSDAYVNIPTALPDFPIFFAIRDPEERENEYCKMIKIIAEYVINLDRDIFMDERFWHSWFSLYKREYLLNTYPQIKEDYNAFKNIVIKRFDWENYIYKAILIAQYVEENTLSDKHEYYYRLILQKWICLTILLNMRFFVMGSF